MIARTQVRNLQPWPAGWKSGRSGCYCLEAEPLPLQKPPSRSLRLPPACMRPARVMEGDLLCLKSSDGRRSPHPLRTLTAAPPLVSDEARRGPDEVTHKTRHYTSVQKLDRAWLRERSVQPQGNRRVRVPEGDANACLGRVRAGFVAQTSAEFFLGTKHHAQRGEIRDGTSSPKRKSDKETDTGGPA